MSEAAVAAGVRRIEAKTADGARQHLNAQARKLREAAGVIKAPADEIAERVAALAEERRKLEKELGEAKRKLAMGGGGSGGGEASNVVDVGGVKYFRLAVSGVDMKDLKALADEAKQKVGSGVVAVVNTAEDGKAGVVVGVTADLVARFNAVELVRAASETLGGKGGGGRPDMAQAGGPDGSQAQAALDAIAARLVA